MSFGVFRQWFWHRLLVTRPAARLPYSKAATNYALTATGVTASPTVGTPALSSGAGHSWTIADAIADGVDVKVWLDAKDAATITSSSNVVSAWNDKSGNANHATAASGHRPLLTPTNTNFGSQPTIGPSANQQGMSIGGGYTFPIVNLYTTSAAAGFVGDGIGLGNAQSNIAISYPEICLLGFTLASGSSTALANRVWKNGVSDSGTTTSYSVSRDWSFFFIGRLKSVGMNGTAGRFADSGAPGIMDRISDYARTIDADWGECVIIDASADTTLRQKIEGYLAWKWGQQSLLPSGHPYKSAAPTVGTPSNDLGTPPGITASPTVGSPAITQKHAFTTAGITASPTVGQPAASIRRNLTATGIATAAPSVGSPTVTQKHSLTATGVTASPQLGAPAFSQNDHFMATGPTASPVVGTPAITQKHALTATGVAASPVVGSPAVGQKHALTATGITASPVVGSPGLSENQGAAATGIIASPVVGTPALSQKHALLATGITAAPVVGTAALAQKHVLAAVGITASPTVGHPGLAENAGFLAEDIAAGSPSLGHPTLTQAHVLAATGITAAPTVGTPDLVESSAIVPRGVTASPVVGTPAIHQNHHLSQASQLNIATDQPTVGRPGLGQAHVLAATGLIVSPLVGHPILHENLPGLGGGLIEFDASRDVLRHLQGQTKTIETLRAAQHLILPFNASRG